MLYTIEYFEDVVTQQIPHIPEPFKTAIKRAIEERISIDPITFGKPLRYSLREHRRLRLNCRHYKHRKDVYE